MTDRRLGTMLVQAARPLLRHRWANRIVFLAMLVLLTGPAWGRLGGGESFSGPSSGGEHDGGGGGGGADILVYLLIQLVLRHPAIGIPVVIVVVVVFALAKANQPAGYSSAQGSAGVVAPPRNRPVEAGLAELRKIDPDFSVILFEDFVYTLFGKLQEARGASRLADYAPYLDQSLWDKSRGELTTLGSSEGRLREVSGVIIGAARITNVTDTNQPTIAITVEFESNYTETRDAGQEGKTRQTGYYTEEIWEFSRAREVKSRPPDKIRVLDCPNCGSSLELKPDGSCVHCGVKVERGDFHWFVTRIKLLARETRGPRLTQDVPEVGTDLPTVFDRRLPQAKQEFAARHPDFDWDRTQERYRTIFLSLQKAWSSLEWEQARPFVSDSLFQYLSFWITEFRRQQLKNRLSSITIESVFPCKLRMDKYYDALTARIYASMIDVTVNQAGKLVRGDPRRPRRFSEYWTFIRRSAASEFKGENTNCPNCGAALKVNMAGVCAFCGSKLTSGEFDWVLSRIEQDEAYGG